MKKAVKAREVSMWKAAVSRWCTRKEIHRGRRVHGRPGPRRGEPKEKVSMRKGSTKRVPMKREHTGGVRAEGAPEGVVEEGSYTQGTIEEEGVYQERR